MGSVEIDVCIFDGEGYGYVAPVVCRSDYAFDSTTQVCFIQTGNLASQTEDTQSTRGSAVSMAPFRQAWFLNTTYFNILFRARSPTLENRAAVRFLAVFGRAEGHGAGVVCNVVRVDVCRQVYYESEVGYTTRLSLVVLLRGFAVRAHYVDERCWGGFGEDTDGVFEGGGVGVVERFLDVYGGVYDGVSVLETWFRVVR